MIESKIGMCDSQPLRNSFTPPHCGNCDRLERRTKELEGHIVEMQSHVLEFPVLAGPEDE